MKKIILSAAFLFIIFFVFVSCGSQTPVLNVYNWGEYIADGDECLDVNKAFEEYYFEKTGQKVKVNYTTYSSNEELYAKLTNTSTSYDVIIPSDYMIALLIEEGLIQPLNFDNIPNMELIDQQYIDNNYYDVENRYSVPYTVGRVGLIYNSELIQDEITSWSALWNEEYKDLGILQFNNQRDAFAIAQFYKNVGINSHNTADWDIAYEALVEQKKIIQKYVMDEVFNKMETGNAAIAPYYAGDYFTMYGINDALEFVYPTEGSNVFIDAMCIPSNATNKELAEAYINFLLEPEIAIENAEYICYASPNTAVYTDPDYIEYMNELHPEAIDILYGTEMNFEKEGFTNLPDDILKYMNEKWDDLKIETEDNTMLYVICGVVIVAIIGLGVFVKVRKNIRNKNLSD